MSWIVFVIFISLQLVAWLWAWLGHLFSLNSRVGPGEAQYSLALRTVSPVFTPSWPVLQYCPGRGSCYSHILTFSGLDWTVLYQGQRPSTRPDSMLRTFESKDV